MIVKNGLQLLKLSTSNYNKSITSNLPTVKGWDGVDTDLAIPGFTNTNSSDRGVLFFVNGYYTASDITWMPAFYFLSNNTTLFFGSSTNTSAEPANCGTVLGDGDTLPALDDYCLSGNQITDFTANTSISVSVSDALYADVTYTITNTGASAFTIKEIGCTRKNKNVSPGIRVLIARFVLDAPVTIEPGNQGVVTFRVKINP